MVFREEIASLSARIIHHIFKDKHTRTPSFHWSISAVIGTKQWFSWDCFFLAKSGHFGWAMDGKSKLGSYSSPFPAVSTPRQSSFPPIPNASLSGLLEKTAPWKVRRASSLPHPEKTRWFARKGRQGGMESVTEREKREGPFGHQRRTPKKDVENNF